MKLDAIIDRGNRKDFHALFWILKQPPLAVLFSLGAVKVPELQDFCVSALASGIDFENAGWGATT